jgi:hypothetical protein
VSALDVLARATRGRIFSGVGSYGVFTDGTPA